MTRHSFSKEKICETKLFFHLFAVIMFFFNNGKTFVCYNLLHQFLSAYNRHCSDRKIRFCVDIIIRLATVPTKVKEFVLYTGDSKSRTKTYLQKNMAVLWEIMSLSILMGNVI